MKISHNQPPVPYRVRPMQLAFAVCAAVVAISLLSFYVQLVNQAVERGAHLRYEQQSSLTKPSPSNTAKAISAVASSETAVRE